MYYIFTALVFYILGYQLAKLSKWESVSFVYPSELSNPKVNLRKTPRTFRNSRTNAITKKLLEDNPEARDDKELFISIVSCHTSKFTELETFSRSWRYVQQHFPELRGKHWVDRQVHSDLIRKSI
jgi:hypothetical protein